MLKQQQTSRMRWSEETTVKFISLYRDHTCLWDTSNRDYRNKQVREAAYSTIVAEMSIEGFGVPEAKQKVKNLQSTYTQELKKISMSRRPPLVKDEMIFEYVPTLKWFPIMDSIWKVIKEKNALKAKLDYDISMLTEIKAEEIDDSSRIFPPCEVSIHEVEGDYPPPPKRQRTNKETPNMKDALDVMKSLTDILSSRDDCSVYGEHIANKLRTCGRNRVEVAIAQHKIDQIIFNLIMGDFSKGALTPDASRQTDQAYSPPDQHYDSLNEPSTSPDQPSTPPEYNHCDLKDTKSPLNT